MNKDLKNSINTHFFESSKSTDVLRKSKEYTLEKVSYDRFTQLIYRESNKNNIKNILDIENTILKNDLNRATDNREINSIKAGINRITLATNSLSNITRYKSFEKYTNSTSFKDIDSKGLPKDAFRKEVPAQITSLQNNTRDNKAQHIRDYLDARIFALKNAENLYKVVQHKHMERFCKEHPEHPHSQNYLLKNTKQLIEKNSKER